jgi:crotonobetainyl-CoA:carnitine CoA-transferase CaiB-like acyl-CoA transferase
VLAVEQYFAGTYGSTLVGEVGAEVMKIEL